MIEYTVEIKLAGYTLVLPSVSVGNVGQLTVDLLINTLDLKHLGYVWHSSVIPVVGSDPFGNSKTIATSCELFYSEKLKLVVMQIRSGILRTKSEFVQFVCKWIREEQLKQVIILTGSSAHERRDQQLTGRPLRYLSCPLTSLISDNSFLAEQWKEYESKEMSTGQASGSSEISYIPGSGIALKLYKNCIREEIPCALLIEFCSDGNNAPDALRLADYLNEWLKLKEKFNVEDWIPPPSWVLMFGPLPPTEIFN